MMASAGSEFEVDPWNVKVHNLKIGLYILP